MLNLSRGQAIALEMAALLIIASAPFFYISLGVALLGFVGINSVALIIYGNSNKALYGVLYAEDERLFPNIKLRSIKFVVLQGCYFVIGGLAYREGYAFYSVLTYPFMISSSILHSAVYTVGKREWESQK